MQLRDLLMGHPALGALLGAADEEARPSLDALGAQVDDAWQHVRQEAWAPLGALLVELLPELEVATQHGPRKAVGRGLALKSRAACVAFSRLDDFDGAWVAGDRASAAGALSDDRLWAVAAQLRIAEALLRAQRWKQAQAVVDGAVDALEGLGPAGKGGRGTGRVVLRGASLLVRAAVAARQQDRRAAMRSLSFADAEAEALGLEERRYDVDFGPTAVRLAQLEAAVWLSDAGFALSVAEEIALDDLSARQRALVLVHVAAARAQRQDVDEAMQAVAQALALWPEVAAVALVSEVVQMLERLAEPGQRARVKKLSERVLRVG